MGAHGPQVREQFERRAEPEQCVLRSRGGRRIVPGGTADGPEQHRIGLAAGRQRARGQRLAEGIHCRSAHELLVPAHQEAEALARGIDAASRDGADLRSDPVAGKVGNAVRGHAPLPAVVAGFATTACSAMSLFTAARYARRLASTTLVDKPWPVKVRGTSVSPAGAAILTVASP